MDSVIMWILQCDNIFILGSKIRKKPQLHYISKCRGYNISNVSINHLKESIVNL